MPIFSTKNLHKFFYTTRDAASVAQNIKELSQLEKVPTKLRSYLFPRQKPNIYPLSKFLILYTVLFSDVVRDFVLGKVNNIIDDPWYKFWIKEYYS